MMAQVGRL